jgi:hypothetical protein
MGALAVVVPMIAMAVPARARAGSPIKDDEDVVLFATAAHREGTGWRVPLHAWIFEPEHGSLWRGGAVRGVRAALDVEAVGARRARLEVVARWFLVDNERGKALEIELGSGLEGGQIVTLPDSAADGHARGSARLPAREPGWITVRTWARDGRRFTGQVQLVPETGVTVVSDIDDTIKVTEVLRGNRRVVERTLLEPFEAVPGMARAYAAWAADGAVFHYVSGSPWHLYPELTRWMARSRFPRGTLALRTFRPRDSSRWNLLESPRRHKLAAIGALLRRYPRRRFVLVGDSGESDPEIYGELARTFGAQVRAIAIRRLPGDAYGPARVARAIAGVRARVIAFESPTELAALGGL